MVCRIHRFRDMVRATDLTNAGARGARCAEFSLEAAGEALPFWLAAVPVGETIERDVAPEAWAAAIALAPQGYVQSHRGVDVAPAGFVTLEVSGPEVSIRAEWDSFCIKDKRDRNNEPTAITPMKRKAGAVRAFYAFVRDHAAELAEMTFNDILTELAEQGIGVHYYCARD